MGCGVVLLYLDRLPAIAEEYRTARAGPDGGSRARSSPRRSSRDRDRLPRRPAPLARRHRGGAFRRRPRRAPQQDQRLPGPGRRHGDQRRLDAPEDGGGNRARCGSATCARCRARSRTRPSGAPAATPARSSRSSSAASPKGCPTVRASRRADFGQAVVRAADSAYQAIARPVEGTILTVIRDWARHVAARAPRGPGLREAPARVAGAGEGRARGDTPRQMQVLKKAGVVDAGAQAFVYLIEGIVRYLREAARGAIPEAPPEDVKAAIFDRTPEEILFRFCTEALLEGDDIDRDALRREAALLRRLDRHRRERLARAPARPHQRAGEGLLGRGAASPRSRRRRSRTCAPSTRRASTRTGRSASASSPTRRATCRTTLFEELGDRRWCRCASTSAPRTISTR